MIAYLLAGVAIVVAFIVNWFMPRPFWRATLTSALSIFIITSVGLMYLPLGVEAEPEEVRRWVFSILPLLGFFAILISVFVGWFLYVVRK